MTTGAIGLRLGELVERDVAEPEVPDQALLPQLGQGAELLGERLVAGALRDADPQVDHVEGVQAEVLEVLPDLGLEVVGLQRRDPAAVRRRGARRPW